MTTRQFFLIDPSKAPDIWHNIKPLIEKTLPYSEGEMTPSDSLRMIMNEEQQLWLGIDDGEIFLALITEIIRYPQKSTLRIINFSTQTEHGMDIWYDQMLETLNEFGLKVNCTNLEAWCRKGLARKLDWEHEYVVISKPIKPKEAKQPRKRRRRSKTNGQL